MPHFTHYGIALGLLAACLTPAEADPVALDATVAVNALAQVDDSPVQYQRLTRAADANFDPITVSADAGLTTDDGSAEAYTSVTATWDSAAHGSVQFGNTGFTTQLDAAGGQVNIDGTHWTYRFRSTNEDQLSLAYEVDLTPDTTDPTGLDSFRFVVILGGYDPIFEQLLAPGDMGVLTVPLEPGQTYTVSLIPRAGLSGDVGARTAAMTGDFTWSVGSGG
jgi:hypothetical protein